MEFIKDLQEGALDVVGDIHGEIDALRSLLDHLGYDYDGNHPNGRKLVFIGDLCDRGPDSPAVIRLVKRMVQAGNAQALLGNHELNFLRQQAKDGSGWYQPRRVEKDSRKYAPFVIAFEKEQQEYLNFISTLPLALEREDIRLVHAAWDKKSIELVRKQKQDSVLACFEQFENSATQQLEESGITALRNAELDEWKEKLEDPDANIPFLNGVAEYDAGCQMLNPIRVLTSGIERPGSYPFFSSGQWRFVERAQWWNDYQEEIPVIIGHYWRRAVKVDRATIGKGDPDLFEGVAPYAWHGAKHNVFCVDYSVGGRWQERKSNAPIGSMFKLAALRWPEEVIVFDTGEVIEE